MQGLLARKPSPRSVFNRYLCLSDVQDPPSAFKPEQDFRVLREGLRGEGLQGPSYPAQLGWEKSALTTRSSAKREKDIQIADQELFLTIAERAVLRRIGR